MAAAVVSRVPEILLSLEVLPSFIGGILYYHILVRSNHEGESQWSEALL